MATDKPKITAYLDLENSAALEDFRSRRQLSISQAINEIIRLALIEKPKIQSSTFTTEIEDDGFEQDYEPEDDDTHKSIIEQFKDNISYQIIYKKEEFKIINERLDRIEKHIGIALDLSLVPEAPGASTAPSTAPSNAPITVEAPGASTAPSNAPSTAPITVEAPGASTAPSNAPSTAPIKKPEGLTGSELADRLKCNPGTLSKNRDKANFRTWTKEKDPDAIPWDYDWRSKTYFPVI